MVGCVAQFKTRCAHEKKGEVLSTLRELDQHKGRDRALQAMRVDALMTHVSPRLREVEIQLAAKF